jgi:hypothetical protein
MSLHQFAGCVAQKALFVCQLEVHALAVIDAAFRRGSAKAQRWRFKTPWIVYIREPDIMANVKFDELSPGGGGGGAKVAFFFASWVRSGYPTRSGPPLAIPPDLNGRAA